MTTTSSGLAAQSERADRWVNARRVAWGMAAAVLLAGVVFEASKHGGWTIVLAVLGYIGPDLSFFIGIGEAHEHGQLPSKAVRPYNALHRPLLPGVLMVLSAFASQPFAAYLITLGGAWLVHIAIDRASGYGLRAREGSRL